MNMYLLVVLDFENLDTLLATQRQSIDLSVCADGNYIKYQFEDGSSDRIYWGQGCSILARPDTELDSSLIEAHQLQ